VKNQSYKPKEEVPLHSAAPLYVAYHQSSGSNSVLAPDSDVVSDVQWIQEYFANDYSIAVTVLQLFIDEILPEVNELEKVLTKKGNEELRKKVHKINPSFKMVGQSSLANALSDLENLCSSVKDAEKLRGKIKLIQAQTEKIKPQILKQYQTISKLAI
jgi:HPt (histidine-containing phosphotransfer) domain-containing protein